MLNPEQQQAVSVFEGPLRIIAGAGTGKTHTLIERIHNIISVRKIQQQNILALTFTNRAAHELKNRLHAYGHDNVHAMTFHALAARLLRFFWEKEFVIGDESMKVSNDFNESNGPNDTALEKPVILTFDDLLKQLLILWRDKNILSRCQSLYTHILVDEYQDLNPDQIAIVHKLADKHGNICVVGDPDQTIYSWRDADPEALQNFSEIYPQAQTVTLTQNYRNPPNILKSAENLIQNNPNRLPKILESTKSAGQTTQLWFSNNYSEHNEILAHLLEQKLGSHSSMLDADQLDKNTESHEYSFGDIAIIYRTQNQGKNIARYLENRGYPCQRSAPDEFWQKPEIIKFLKEIELALQLPELASASQKQLGFSQWLNQKINQFLAATEATPTKQNILNLLLSFGLTFNTLSLKEALQQFLDEAKINQEIDNILKPNAINLLTFHAAKGLEFPIVIISGLEEEIMPYKMSLHDPELLAEERRLMYVGMTRTTEELHLLANSAAGPKSRFIQEIRNFEISTLPQHRKDILKKRSLKRAQLKMF